MTFDLSVDFECFSIVLRQWTHGVIMWYCMTIVWAIKC